jgi:hypothetical protein
MRKGIQKAAATTVSRFNIPIILSFQADENSENLTVL